jgi:hypothetical protein
MGKCASTYRGDDIREGYNVAEENGHRIFTVHNVLALHCRVSQRIRHMLGHEVVKHRLRLALLHLQFFVLEKVLPHCQLLI